MSLSLRTPVISDSTLDIAITRPSKVKSFIENLPAANPQESGKLLLEELETLNRQKVASQARVKVLELYRPVIFNLQKILDSHYCNERIPLTTKSKVYADLIKLLHTELANGYKLAILDASSARFNLNKKSDAALIVQRCIESLRNVAFICYQCYISTPLGAWSEFNQLFSYALEQGIEDIPVPLNITQQSSIALTFKQALLMQLATPQNLSHIDIKLTAQYLFKNAHLTELKVMREVEFNHHAEAKFIVPLSSELPPTALRESAGFNYDQANYILITQGIIAKIRHDVQSTLAKKTNNTALFENSLTDAKHLGLLRYLFKHWGNFPKRVYSRVKKLDTVEVNIGISSIHYFLNHTDASAQAKPVTPDTLFGSSEFTSDEFGRLGKTSKADEATPQTSRWISFNVSANGAALRKPSDVDENVRVGDLISIRESGKKTWSLAVIKWVMLKDQQKLDIGIQLIAPNANAKNARQLKQSHFEKILLLAGVPTLEQSATIVAPTGIYQPTNQLELIENNQIIKVVITKRLERTSSYERFSFTYLPT